MSDWGHAMMAMDRDSVYHYGDREFTYGGEGAVEIEDLKDIITEAWDESVEFHAAPIDYQHLDAKEVYESFNPSDIVDSAEAWDTELAGWFYEKIAEKNGITAVITDDGAIVLDEYLMTEVTE